MNLKHHLEKREIYEAYSKNPQTCIDNILQEQNELLK